MSDEMKAKKKTYRQLERVSINDEHLEKLSALTDQANQALQGIATITKSDIVNLTLSRREPVLSKSEVDALKSIHFDVFKYLSWLQGQAKSAKENGTDLTLKELFERSHSVIEGVSGTSPTRKPRKRKPTADEKSTPSLSDVGNPANE